MGNPDGSLANLKDLETLSKCIKASGTSRLVVKFIKDEASEVASLFTICVSP